ncbi:TRAP transporter large permease [Natronospirillum operosum]|uniref:TRAP transporter large permease protein n=1 Tax=Natronospirillum operosum TaxID=2759953 RepID=A0A4Z0W860_9GAMM|nr:TRAP transporter large permease [Natronospirillum operosum]TGG94254.1 TRAP transporter large permease [Natronospirillum operosum]
MEWWMTLSLILGALMFLMIIGVPVAFSFLAVNVVGAYIFMGGIPGVRQLVVNSTGALTSFTLVPIAMFMIMGEVMFRSGIANDLMDTLDKWFGKLRGRLAFMAVGGGVLFSTLTGNSMGSIALLGSSLTPEMEKRGYKKPMSLGPIIGSSGLAIMIPPSALAVLLGVVGELSISRILIAIILPGLIMAVLYAAYIWIRCTVQPSVAPTFDIPYTPWPEKLKSGAANIVPIGVVVFSVVGVIFLGWATPTEAAASGAVATVLLALFKRRLTVRKFGASMFESSNLSVMILLIVGTAIGFSQLLAFTGVTFGLMNAVMSLDISPRMIVLMMILSVVLLGMFMGPLPIMLITLPIYIPVVTQLGFDPIWFAVLFLIAIETGATSPPVGAALFVMKGVAPKGTTMMDIYRAAIPFLICDFMALILVFTFPQIVTWPVEMMFR